MDRRQRDPVDFVEALVSSKAIPQPGSAMSNHANFSRWRSPEVDEAIERLGRDRQGSERILNGILRSVAEEVPVFPLLYGSATAVHSWRLRGFRLSAVGQPSFAPLRFED